MECVQTLQNQVADLIEKLNHASSMDTEDSGARSKKSKGNDGSSISLAGSKSSRRTAATRGSEARNEKRKGKVEAVDEEKDKTE